MKVHWYCFSFKGTCLKTNSDCSSSICVSREEKKITMANIREGKKYAGVKDSAVLISASYLGHMTTEEFEG